MNLTFAHVSLSLESQCEKGINPLIASLFYFFFYFAVDKIFPIYGPECVGKKKNKSKNLACTLENQVQNCIIK